MLSVRKSYFGGETQNNEYRIIRSQFKIRQNKYDHSTSLCVVMKDAQFNVSSLLRFMGEQKMKTSYKNVQINFRATLQSDYG